ncbi:MAG: hypoxanthine phosphoribosyltransferase [Candidatus Cloacimonetes bacterium]|nr:hypoxanthine phosphoribosyltransferase [Candidatus Cloacimonadota bacterium]MBL7107906.1 hypoxanthine phosphoribosyltransferase [Candidatus Cloacimonadota bacterium]
MNIKDDIEKILISEKEIQEKIKKVASQISKDYKDKTPLLISILKGGVVFLTDLMRYIEIPIEIDFLGIASYGSSTKSSGVVKITKDFNYDISGRHIIIVEDIVDTGLSLKYIINLIKWKNPESIKICALLDKESAHSSDIKIDYKCFIAPDEFVVGYGLDYSEKYRNLPFIGVLKKEIYNK